MDIVERCRSYFLPLFLFAIGQTFVLTNRFCNSMYVNRTRRQEIRNEPLPSIISLGCLFVHVSTQVSHSALNASCTTTCPQQDRFGLGPDELAFYYPSLHISVPQLAGIQVARRACEYCAGNRRFRKTEGRMRSLTHQFGDPVRRRPRAK
jgi:hypothetical protein